MPQEPPVLIWQPGGGTPIYTPGPPQAGHAAPESGRTYLIEDQAYVDVVFVTTQPRSDWTFAEMQVVNTGDDAPLNIWPGIVTVKSRNGFRLYLNGLPDTGNYYLDWSINGGTVADAGTATSYTLSGPDSGPIGVATSFTVALPMGTIVDVPVAVTPDDGGVGGTFSPLTVELTTDAPSANFTYTPASYGAKTISVTNDQLLTDPDALAFTSVVSAYLFSGPSSGPPSGASTNFTVSLPVGGVTLSTIIVTPADSVIGTPGTFTPTSVNLTTAAPSATFTYTPAVSGAHTISVTNNRGLIDPASLPYTAGLVDGSPISSWPDSFGNGHNATQSGSARPTYKTNIINGKPVARFTAAGASSLNLASSIPGTGVSTCFVVMKETTPGGTLTSLAPASVGFPLALLFTGNATYWGDRVNYHTAGVAVDYGTVFHVVVTGTDGVGGGGLFVDGTQIVAGLTSAASGTTGNYDVIGAWSGSANSNGDIAEIIFYNTILSSTDRANIEKYLGTKYGITVAGGSAVDPSTVSGKQGWWKADAL